MTLSLRQRGVSLVLLDIEGTTTPISFVYDVLFPYARAHIHEFLGSSGGDADKNRVADLLRAEYRETSLRGETPPAWDEGTAAARDRSVAAFALWLMQRDVKSPGLKLLQGFIWERGYTSGQITGDVFPDVPVALLAWNEAGIRSAIYSSGSVLAQKLLFGHSAYGDLTPRISAYFDTGVGRKTESASYAKVASTLAVEPNVVLFVSDVLTELAAAKQSGMQVALCLRPGNAPALPPDGVQTVSSLVQLTA